MVPSAENFRLQTVDGCMMLHSLHLETSSRTQVSCTGSLCSNALLTFRSRLLHQPGLPLRAGPSPRGSPLRPTPLPPLPFPYFHIRATAHRRGPRLPADRLLRFILRLGSYSLSRRPCVVRLPSYAIHHRFASPHRRCRSAQQRSLQPLQGGRFAWSN